MRVGFRVLVPVNQLSRALPRLEADPPLRERLALAFAVDTVTAALRCRRVKEILVLSEDPTVRSAMAELGVDTRVVDSTTDVNAVVGSALRDLADRVPAPICVLMGDLPALETEELTKALDRVSGQSPCVFVEDLAGEGATLVAARVGELRATFGPRAAQRLSRNRVPAVGRDLPGLRCDVDTLGSLRLAAYLGAGRHTSMLLGDALQQPQLGLAR